ncbi:MAG TPA: 3-phosphoshikimate 1-carboxyvinyltransferase [Candidatus Limnocylindrales bacterium]|nr:3-phosphoshikimate 1-carboxyvinyltransferase [Candidatus Limnocylindrales bacterium]
MVTRLTLEGIEPATRFRADLRVPGDKSIAHRAVLLSAIADGESRIRGIPAGEDVSATIACVRRLGIGIEQNGNRLRVEGRPLSEWRSPEGPLDCRNSGTTMRLLSGLLAGSRCSATLVGDASLSGRPMDRVARPLHQMGAQVATVGGHAPLRVEGRPLRGIDYPVSPPSAQVKSAVLLAGLHAEGETTVREAVRTRDHTERLLSAMGAACRLVPDGVRLRPLDGRLRPIDLEIPGDISSAAFLLAAASLRPGFEVRVEAVGLNPTRTAFLDLLRDMGGQVSVQPAAAGGSEPVGTISVVGGPLHAIQVAPDRVAQAIDEIPILLVLATQATGTTLVEGIGELRLKESDRVLAMTRGLRAMGARLQATGDRIAVEGPASLHGAEVDTFQDHRIAMALAVAGLVATSPTQLRGADRVDVSYPGFFGVLREATGARP